MAATGILGGTFDPVHNAHLAMARAALDHLGLDNLLFIPTGRTRYRLPSATAGRDRAAMLRLAIEDQPRFGVDERELQPDATGYTVDTLRALRGREPGVDFVLLVGADAAADLGAWREAEEIPRLARVVTFGRPGAEPAAGPMIWRTVAVPTVDISATDVRTRVRTGRSIRWLVPDAVDRYIAAERLYLTEA